MSDSVFIDAFTRYGLVEEYIDIDEMNECRSTNR